jgi:dihydrofolate reductase
MKFYNNYCKKKSHAKFQSMRKLILNIASSLDGYIAGQRGDREWLVDQLDIQAFLEEIDLVVMGRKTFDYTSSLDSWPYPGVRGHVFSRGLHDNGNEHILWVADDLVRHIKTLKKEGGKNMWLLGGGEIVRHALNNSLIDEMILSIHPVLLGKGIQLFPPTFKLSEWSLMDQKGLPKGVVQLTYQLIKS